VLVGLAQIAFGDMLAEASAEGVVLVVGGEDVLAGLTLCVLGGLHQQAGLDAVQGVVPQFES